MSERDPNHVIIFDTTLRDGEQSPGISLDVAEKVEIVEQLARLGVDIIEAGFPIASQGDFEATKAVAETVGKPGGPVICGLSAPPTRTSTGRGRRSRARPSAASTSSSPPARRT